MVQVYLRLRPLNKYEVHRRSRNVVEVQEENTVVVDGDTKMEVDGVLSEVTNNDTFRALTHSVVQNIVDGQDASVVLYGSSRTGKSTTAHELSESLWQPLWDNLPSSREVTVRVSCCELYLERMRDLLASNNHGVQLENGRLLGCSAVSCVNATDLSAIVEYAKHRRTRSAAHAHRESNRSTLVIQLMVQQMDLETGVQYSSALRLYDCLASDWRHSQAGGKEDVGPSQPLEPRMVSWSLQTLHKSIKDINKGKSVKTPKQLPILSQLLLRDLQSTHCRVIVTASPSHFCVQETLHSLTMASDCRNLPLPRVSTNKRSYDDTRGNPTGCLETLVRALARECMSSNSQSLRRNQTLWESIERINNQSNDFDVEEWDISVTKRGDTSMEVEESVTQSNAYQTLQRECDKAKSDRSQLSSDLAILQAQMLTLKEQNKSQMEEMEQLRRENKLLRVHRQKLDDHLRTSQFRESEAVVFLRQLRRFYYRLLKKTANDGNGDVMKIAARVPGAPDLAQLVDIDHFMMKSGLLEKSEIGGDVSLNCRPSLETLERSAVEAKNATPMEKPPLSDKDRVSADDLVIEPIHPNPAPSVSIKRDESGEKIEARQKLYQTPAGNFIHMREKILEEELLQLSEMNMQLKSQLAEERTNVEALTNKHGVAAAFDKMRVAQDMRILKEQLERKNNDLKAVIWKMNEIHMVGKNLQSQAVSRDQHVAYLEESFASSQNKCEKVITESAALEKKLHQEMRVLKDRADSLTGPVWQYLNLERSDLPLSGRLLVPFLPGGSSLDTNTDENGSLGEEGEWIDEELAMLVDLRVDASTQTSSVDTADSGAQTDDNTFAPETTAITTENIDSLMFMDSPEVTPRQTVGSQGRGVQHDTGRSFDSLLFMNSPETKRMSIEQQPPASQLIAEDFMFMDSPPTKAKNGQTDAAAPERQPVTETNSFMFIESPKAIAASDIQEVMESGSLPTTSSMLEDAPNNVKVSLSVDSNEAKPSGLVEVSMPRVIENSPEREQVSSRESATIVPRPTAEESQTIEGIPAPVVGLSAESRPDEPAEVISNADTASGDIAPQSPRPFGIADRERPTPRRSPLKFRSHAEGDRKLPQPELDFFAGFDAPPAEQAVAASREADFFDFIVQETSQTATKQAVDTDRALVPDFLDSAVPQTEGSDGRAVNETTRNDNKKSENEPETNLSEQTSGLMTDVTKLLSTIKSGTQDETSSKRSPSRSRSEFVARPSKKKPTKNLSSLLGRLQNQHAQKKIEDDEKTETPEFMRLFRKIAHNNTGETVLETSGAVAPRDASELRAGSLLPNKTRSSTTPFSESPSKRWKPKKKSKKKDDSSDSSDDSFARQFIQGARMGGLNTVDSSSDRDSENDSVGSEGAMSGGERSRGSTGSSTGNHSEIRRDQNLDEHESSASTENGIHSPAAMAPDPQAAESSSSKSSQDDQIEEPTPVANKKQPKKSYFSDSDSDSSDDDSPVEEKGSTKNTPVRSAAEKPAVRQESSDSESASDESSVANRPLAAKTQSYSSDLDSSDDDSAAVHKGPNKVTAPSVPSKVAAKAESSDSESSSADHSKTHARVPVPKRSIYSDSSDSDSSDSSDDDTLIARKAVRSANAALKQKSDESSNSSNIDNSESITKSAAPALKPSNDSDSSDGESSSDEEAPTSNPEVSRAQAQDYDSDSDSSSDSKLRKQTTPTLPITDPSSDSSDEESVARARPVAKPASEDEPSDDDSDSSASELKIARSSNKQPPSRPLSDSSESDTATRKSRAQAKFQADSDSDSSSDSADSEPFKKKASAHVPSDDSSSEDDSDTSDDESSRPPKKNPAESAPEVIDLTDHPEPGPRTRVPDYSSQIKSAVSPARSKKKVVIKKVKVGSTSANNSPAKSPAPKAKFVVKNGKLQKQKSPKPNKGKKKVVRKVVKKGSSKESLVDPSHTNLSALDRLNASNQNDRRLSLDSQVPDHTTSPESAPEGKSPAKSKKKKAVFTIVGGKLVKQKKTKKKGEEKKKEDGEVKPKKKKVVKTKKKSKPLAA